MKSAPQTEELIHGTCVDLSYEGKGVFKSEDKTIFVEGMFPGEEGDVRIAYRRNQEYFGLVAHLDVVSPYRIEPRCKICRACGGCEFQQYAYEKQLEWKTNKVKEQFRRIAKMDVEVNPCIGMENPYFYRNKIQMPFGKDQKGNIYCGFYKKNTHAIVPLETCYIEDERAGKILSSIKRAMKSFRVDPYDEIERSGTLRYALIRTSFYKKQIMVVLVTSTDGFKNRDAFVARLLKECPEITTVVQNINNRPTNVILGERERILFGSGYIEDILCGIEFRISAKSFYQTNPVVTEKLYTHAIKMAKLEKTDVVFDAYSGIGTIGLIASKECGKVVSVELVKDAVSDGIKNAKRNNIQNFDMHCDDASSFMVDMAKNKEKVDVLFMDPPRKGSDKRFLDAATKLKPNRIVYVSCEPSTLARDVAYLSKDYEICEIQPFDMFPQTTHVETIVGLSLKDTMR